MTVKGGTIESDLAFVRPGRQRSITRLGQLVFRRELGVPVSTTALVQRTNSREGTIGTVTKAA